MSYDEDFGSKTLPLARFLGGFLFFRQLSEFSLRPFVRRLSFFWDPGPVFFFFFVGAKKGGSLGFPLKDFGSFFGFPFQGSCSTVSWVS